MSVSAARNAGSNPCSLGSHPFPSGLVKARRADCLEGGVNGAAPGRSVERSCQGLDSVREVGAVSG
ncbi:hypothetical protein FTUN_0660 [Frigoriglobus tundricola]|uniref:Uncharacterized protein n=1 Tax=Frigoriglobus tundricola TaxID=2774151 RepID=A0A6M5YGL3_9BACT|nr:hypothetical protein FTUN_0660 [Frigoriglobus tundricola]